MSLPLILASASVARRTLLERAGLSFDVVTSDVDEDRLKEEFGRESPEALADHLAASKALAVSEKNSAALVIGADQILAFNGVIFDKPDTLATAHKHLSMFRGNEHRLISAVVLAQGGDVVWRHTDTAKLRMRPFSDEFLDRYINLEGPKILSSVGAYRLEGLGIQLFDKIDGCHETILGLPLLSLFDELRRRGFLET